MLDLVDLNVPILHLGDHLDIVATELDKTVVAQIVSPFSQLEHEVFRLFFLFLAIILLLLHPCDELISFFSLFSLPQLFDHLALNSHFLRLLLILPIEVILHSSPLLLALDAPLVHLLYEL